MCKGSYEEENPDKKKTTIGGLDLDSSNIPASVLVLVCQRHPRAASKTWVLLLALYGMERQGGSPSLTKHNTSSGSLVFLIHSGPVPNPWTERFFVVDQLIIVATVEWVLLNKRTASRIGPGHGTRSDVKANDRETEVELQCLIPGVKNTWKSGLVDLCSCLVQSFQNPPTFLPDGPWTVRWPWRCQNHSNPQVKQHHVSTGEPINPAKLSFFLLLIKRN